MPGFDGTGPTGTGPNGRGMGPCGGGGNRGFWGFGFRRGGRGGGWFRTAAYSPEEEQSFLEQQKSWLESRLDALKKKSS